MVKIYFKRQKMPLIFYVKKCIEAGKYMLKTFI